MVNFRFHIVSLIAVFLALSIGIIVGTTTLDQGIVRRLEDDLRRQQASSETLNRQNAATRQALDVWETYAEAQLRPLVQDRLEERRVVLLVGGQITPTFLADVQTDLIDAGAEVAGTITFTNKWLLDELTAREQLALTIGVTTDDIGQLLSEAATDVAARLATPGNPRSDGDLFQQLGRAGFVTLAGVTSGEFPPAGSVVLWLSPGTEQSPSIDRFVVPLLAAIPTGTPAAAAEPLGVETSLADEVRANSTLAQRIPTVDHADTAIGRYGLIVGISDVVAGLPATHYGVGRRASGVAPPFAEPARNEP